MSSSSLSHTRFSFPIRSFELVLHRSSALPAKSQRKHSLEINTRLSRRFRGSWEEPRLRRCSTLEFVQDMAYREKSAGSGDSSTSGDRICKCGLIASLKVSNSKANPGREYYSCPEGRCRWFR
ncbi:hypothetical protein PIB30_086374 [Stylosanthes scabra]|uniref:GRF-type domain-containing protein n=1 Tax=Stylosanthes scabra TaxID=79078 RepID=A0ABU6SUH6_9FABA|nr:hypothetical protein [Stylosanthes scabra]